ncbi:MAG TPA: succinate dehydrogenase, hydrophobic membrane anchor protein [Salinisphaeraceae bacterium]|nr:succinate dehydrogenase, hydrophobic membrane anchor protein [Salinisphaeraceae bacterium]
MSDKQKQQQNTPSDDAQDDKHNSSQGTGGGATNTSGDSSNSDNGDDDIIRVARTPSSPALQTELEQERVASEARALGAGHTGSTIFYLQRLTAVALVPLAIWFVVGVVSMTRGAQTDAAAWLGWPINAVLMGLFIVIALRHAVIGIRIIFEDYVGNERLRGACMLAIEALALIIGVGAVAALILLALM